MTQLNPKKVPTKLETVTVTKLDNGYSVTAGTSHVGVVSHYCSNLRGVTKWLWEVFEGKTRIDDKTAKVLREAVEESRNIRGVGEHYTDPRKTSDEKKQ